MILQQTVLAAATTTRDVPALTWMALHLPTAAARTLTRADLARLDAYHGTALALHELLPAVVPLAHPRWWETALTAQHGTAMELGYLAVPHGADAIAVGWVAYAPAFSRLLGPVGPSVVTAAGMTRPDGISDMADHETRVAVGIVLRALLLDLGTPDAA